MDDNGTKTITIKCTWVSYHDIEVPDDLTVPTYLSDFPADALAEMTSNTAELVDWE